MPKIILGLGSNLGNRAANLQSAIAALPDCLSDIRFSGIYESAAVLLEGAPAAWNIPYYNMAVSGHTELHPKDLLAVVKDIEQKLGRKQQERWAPREIDMDILAYGEEQVTGEKLTIPHPYLLLRDFALLPLVELWPDWRYPGSGEFAGQRAADIAAKLGYQENSALRKVTVQLHAA